MRKLRQIASRTLFVLWHRGMTSANQQKLEWLRTLVVLAFAGNIFAAVSQIADAQIVPDDSLGAERSRLTSQGATDQIEGGAIRGAALFHSFSEFNVNARQQVYFANPAAITNILTRVTGNSASNILGTLGVEGRANLFLINPNGIVFGRLRQRQQIVFGLIATSSALPIRRLLP